MRRWAWISVSMVVGLAAASIVVWILADFAGEWQSARRVHTCRSNLRAIHQAAGLYVDDWGTTASSQMGSNECSPALPPPGEDSWTYDGWRLRPYLDSPARTICPENETGTSSYALSFYNEVRVKPDYPRSLADVFLDSILIAEVDPQATLYFGCELLYYQESEHVADRHDGGTLVAMRDGRVLRIARAEDLIWPHGDLAYLWECGRTAHVCEPGIIDHYVLTHAPPEVLDLLNHHADSGSPLRPWTRAGAPGGPLGGGGFWPRGDSAEWRGAVIIPVGEASWYLLYLLDADGRAVAGVSWIGTVQYPRGPRWRQEPPLGTGQWQLIDPPVSVPDPLLLTARGPVVLEDGDLWIRPPGLDVDLPLTDVGDIVSFEQPKDQHGWFTLHRRIDGETVAFHMPAVGGELRPGQP